jgi:hypothetical protein
MTKLESTRRKKQDKKQGFWDRVFKTKKLKKGKVAVLFLKNNGIAETHELESRRGFFNLYGKTYHERRDCVYTMGKERYPLAIIPEWNVIPLGRKDWYDKAMQEKFSTLQDHVMKGIRHAERVRMEEKDGTGIKAKNIIVWAIAAAIVLAVLTGYI